MRGAKNQKKVLTTMNTQDEEKFNTIVKEFTERTLDKLSKQQLDDYFSFLMKCGSANSFNIDTYNRMCDHINSLLMHQETQKKLEELKKPHWSIIPSLLIGFAAMVAASIAAYFAVYPRSPQSSISFPSSPVSKLTVQNVASSSRKQLRHTQSQLSTSRRKLP